MEESEEADQASLLISVLRHLPILAANPNQAEEVFGTIRNAALRSHPSLPYVARVLSKVSALAVSAKDAHVRQVATATCGSLVTCLSRTEGPEQAACYLAGLCHALSNVVSTRARGSRSPVNFLEEFECQYVNTVNVNEVSVEEAPLPDEVLQIQPGRQTLSGLFALLLRTMPVSHRAMHHPADMMFAGMMWVSVPDSARDAVALQLSHPVLLTGCHGFQAAMEAVTLLSVFVDNVGLSSIAKAQLRNRLAVSLCFHTQSDADASPERDELTVTLLKILRHVSSSSGICPKVWAEAGVPAIVRGSMKVSTAAAQIATSGFVSNVDPSEIADLILSPSLTSKKRPRSPVRVAGGEDTNADSAHRDATLNLSNSISNVSFILFDSSIDIDPKLSAIEQLFLLAIIDELHVLENVSQPRRMHCYERLCFLAVTRCGLWKSKHKHVVWRRLAAQLLARVVKVLQQATCSLSMHDCTEAYALCGRALELLYMTVEDARVHEKPERDLDAEDFPQQTRQRRLSDNSLEEMNTWSAVISASVKLLEKTAAGGDYLFGEIDFHEIPRVVRLLSWFSADQELFSGILPSGLGSKIYSLCSSLTDLSLQWLGDEPKRERFIKILECFPAMVIVCPISKVPDVHLSVAQLMKFIVSVKESSVLSVSHGLVALGHCACISARCRGDHRPQSKSVFLPSANEDIWNQCYSVIERILRDDDRDIVLGSAAKSFMRLALHCPSGQRKKCWERLIECVWHPTSRAVRRCAMSAVELIISFQDISETGAEGGQDDSISSALNRAQDSWDGPNSALRSPSGNHNASTLLGVELQAQLRKSTLESQSPGTGSAVIDEDPHCLAFIARLPPSSVATGKVAAIALDALIAGCINDLRSLHHSTFTSSSIDFSETGSQKCPSISSLQFWREFLHMVSALGDLECAVHSEYALQMSGCTCKPWLMPVSRSSSSHCVLEVDRSKRAQISEIAGFLSARMKDWLPLTLERMMSNSDLPRYLSFLLLENELTLWKRVPRYALGTVLREKNVKMLEMLASRLQTSKRKLVDLVCADAIARSALMSPVGIDINNDGSNLLIQDVMKQPLREVIRKRAGKIVQRVVMELGGDRDSSARRALDSLARVLSLQHGLFGAGELVSRHFLLVMDAADRVLLYENVPELERIRCLCMLKAVFQISKENLRMYVPKVFATLKICLSDTGASASFKGKTVEAWVTFLSSLGVKHVGPHLGSMLALLLPQVSNHSSIIVPVLRDLIQNGKPYLTPIFPEILLLLRTVTHPSLEEITSFLENDMGSSSRDGSGGAQLFESTCLQFLNVAKRHESSEIRFIALDQLLKALRANRHQVDALLSVLKTSDTSDTSTPLLAVLVINLVSLVSESKEGFGMRALECLGELGAIDPALIMPHAKSCRKQDGALESKQPGIGAEDRKFPKSSLSLARFLLEVHLAPALWRSDRLDSVGSRLNRVGLAIQELLKACGCKRDTATRARESAVDNVIIIDGDEMSGSENQARRSSSAGDIGISFWNSLSQPVQTAAQPYLLEPFDVQTYASVIGTGKKGDIGAACTFVWASLEIDGKSVIVEDWRRQVVFQAIDFLGGEGNFGALFQAVRPALRYEHGIVASIFPHVVMMALDFEREAYKSNHLCTFFVNEMQMALCSSSTAAPCVFSVLDMLRFWWHERALERGTVVYHAQRKKTKGSRSRCSPLASIVEDEKRSDPLSPLLCLHGGTSKVISLFHQSKAALLAGAHPRAVMLAEQHIRNLRYKNGNEAWPASISKLVGGADFANACGTAEKNSVSQAVVHEESQSLGVLQRAFAALEGADSLKGVAALRKTSNLGESIVDAEASGNFDEALLTYERALAQCPKDEKLHIGFLRCLCTLGHWETMLAHASGLAISAPSLSLDSEYIQKTTRSLGVEAAWRLGRWDHLDELYKGGTISCISSPRLSDFDADISNTGEAIGRTLLHVHRKDWEVAGIPVRQTRSALLRQVGHAAQQGYSRAYPLLVQLHTLADVEDLAEVTRKRATVEQSQVGNADATVLELARMDFRSSTASVSLRVREPLLSARRACLEMLGYRSLAANVSIELAQLARESGNLRAATAAASHALSNTEPGDATYFACRTEMARIQRTRGDDAGALLRLKKVIEGMTIAHEASAAGGRNQNGGKRIADLFVDRGQTSPLDASKRLCAAHVLAGQWIEDSRSESSEVILWHYIRATEYSPKSDQAFYALGRYYDSLWQAGSAANEKAGDSRYGRRSTGSQGAARNGSVSKIRKNHFEYVPLVIENFATALHTGYSRLYEALPRLLTVWFDFYTSHAEAGNSATHIQGVEPSVRRAMNTAFSVIPPYMWMSVIPQLLSRLLHSSSHIRTEVTGQLARLLVRFPEQCVWLILPSTQLQTMERKNAVRHVINTSVALARKAHVSSVRTPSSGGRSIISAEDKALSKRAVQKLRLLISRGTQVVKDLIQVCKMQSKLKKGGHENCREEFQVLKRHLSEGRVIVPTLRALTASLPGALSADRSGGEGTSHRAFAEEPVSIVDIEDNVLVMSSLMQPRRVGFLGSDGRPHRFLAKRENNGDMRKDSRLMDFVTVVNRLLAKDSQARERDLQLKTYAVIPLTEETGMIEWVNDLAPLRVLVREEQSALGKLPDTVSINQEYQRARSKREFLEGWALRQFPPMLDRFFLRKFARGGDAAAWLSARTTWTRTVAAWSMTGYIVGLGDRHAENILIETTSGRAVHVDFAMLFDKGAALKVPEVTPFRLTPNMVGAFGISGTEGAFRVACEVSLRVLRGNTDGLMGTLESFLHDPLADWNRHGNRYALETRHSVRNKLKGIVDGSGIALSIQGQVEKLIMDATSLDKLSQMYIWWSAWT